MRLLFVAAVGAALLFTNAANSHNHKRNVVLSAEKCVWYEDRLRAFDQVIKQYTKKVLKLHVSKDLLHGITGTD